MAPTPMLTMVSGDDGQTWTWEPTSDASIEQRVQVQYAKSGRAKPVALSVSHTLYVGLSSVGSLSLIQWRRC